MPHDLPHEDDERGEAEIHLERATDFFHEGDLDAAEAELRASLAAGLTEFWRAERRRDLAALLVNKARRMASADEAPGRIVPILREAWELDPENADAAGELEARGETPAPPERATTEAPPPPVAPAPHESGPTLPPAGKPQPVAMPAEKDGTPPDVTMQLQSFRENPRLAWTVIEDLYDLTPNDAEVRALHQQIKPLAEAQGMECRHA